MNKMLTKRSKGKKIAVLSAAALLCATLGLSLAFGLRKMTNASTAVAFDAVENTYASAHKMNHVPQSSGSSTYFYNYNPSSPTTFNGDMAYLQGSGSAIKANVTAEHDIALVWTAPADGSFYIQRSSSSRMVVTTNLGKVTDHTETKVAFLMGAVDATSGVMSVGGRLQQNRYESAGGVTYSDDGIFYSIKGYTPSGTDATTSQSQFYMPSSTSAVSIKQGESFIVLACMPTYSETSGRNTSGYRQVQFHNFDICFTEDGVSSPTTYSVSDTILKGENGLDSSLSVYAVESASWATFGTAENRETYTETYEDLSATKKTVEYPFHSNTGNGQFVNNEALSSNWDIVVNGSSTKINTKAGRDSSIYWKARNDSTVYIDHITFTHVGGGDGKVAVILKTKEGKYLSIRDFVTLSSTNTVAAYEGITFDVMAGEEILFTAQRNTSDMQVSIDATITSVGADGIQTASIKPGSATVTAQGQHGFYYGKICNKDLTDVDFSFGDAGLYLTSEGAAKSGIYFDAKIDSDDYAWMKTLYGENIRVGMAIMPKDYVDAHGALSLETLHLSGDTAGYIYTNETDTESGLTRIVHQWTFQDLTNIGDEKYHHHKVAVVKLKETNIDRDFVAMAYIIAGSEKRFITFDTGANAKAVAAEMVAQGAGSYGYLDESTEWQTVQSYANYSQEG